MKANNLSIQINGVIYDITTEKKSFYSNKNLIVQVYVNNKRIANFLDSTNKSTEELINTIKSKINI